METTPLYGGANVTRVEVTSSAECLTNLFKKKNPFLKLGICHPGAAPEDEDDVLWKLYQDSCRFRGLDAATAILPKEKRPKFYGQLVESGALCWQPKKLWEFWPEALLATGLLTVDQWEYEKK